MKSINEKLFADSEISNLENIVGGETYTCDGDNCDVHNGDQGSTWCDDITVTDCDKDYAGAISTGSTTGTGTKATYTKL